MTHHDNTTEPDPANRATSPGTDFVELFTRHQRRLYVYILSQVPNTADAEEILQETNLIIWRKSDRFTLGTNFFAWAARIATFEVLKYRERRGRERVCFSEKFIDTISAEAAENDDEAEHRRQALTACLRKLRDEDRELIQRRYAPGENGKSIAASLGRPANSVYQSLGRIRKALLECIRRRLSVKGPS